jgi:hypothetical protein
MNKFKILPFGERTPDFTPEPRPASRFMPEWYRKQPGEVRPGEMIKQGVIGSTVKRCMPIFDMMSAGYIFSAPCDIYVNSTNPDKLEYSLPMAMKQFQSDIFATHSPEQYSEYPIDLSINHKDLLRILPFWAIKLPPGYSLMAINPSHRDDSPLWAFGGIIDADKFIVDGHFSFLVRKGFDGIIKQGTPLVQIIPFKREDWETEIVPLEEAQKMLNAQRYNLRSVFQNGYKIKFRSKKEYK